MTSLAVCCILVGMEQDEWTEAQLIQFAQDHSFKDVTWRKIKRFRQEGVLATPRVVHLGFGPGTTSLYPADAGLQVLAICRLLKQRRDYDAVRFWLWLEGNPIEIGRLKASIWRLVPFSSLSIPETGRERKFAAKRLARIALRRAWQSVRSNLLRKILQQFADQEEQEWFMHLQMDLLYGEPLDFSRDLLNEHDPELRDALEEPADIIAHGLQAQQIHFIREGEDIAKALQQLADEKLLSLTRLRTVLFAATEVDLELARTRRDLLSQLFETLDLMGYLKGLLRLYQKAFAAPAMQALAFAFPLVLEQGGYGHNIEEISSAVRINLPIMKRTLALREILMKELPSVAKEVPSLPVLGRLLTDGTQQQRDAYFEHLQEVYWQNKEAFDAFWQRHPDLKPE